MLIRTPASSSGRRNASLVNWLPWSVFEINGVPCRRSASSTALTQKPTSIVLSSSQASTKRLAQSITATR